MPVISGELSDTPVLGTPASGTLTNCTGLPISTGVSGLAAGVAAFLATPSSANMATMITDETGSGANVFATGPTMTGPILAAGTNTVAPLKLTSGINLTTAAAGAWEFDGSVFYGTAVASARQAINAEQVQILNATRTFTNNTSPQAIFNATTNGAITLAATTTYEFEMMVAASGFSSSAHTINLGFALGGSLSSMNYYYDAQTGSTLAGPTAGATGFVAVNTATPIVASGSTTGLLLYVRGTIRSNAAGTFTPQLTQVTASAAAVVQPGSFIRVWPIGSNTVTNVGNWS